MKPMNYLHPIFKIVDRYFPFTVAQAHCDVPCGIYDPSTAQIAALTVVRMIDLMEKLESETEEKNLSYHNTLSRHIAEKERHAIICKDEIRVIWGDYFKKPQLDAHPDTHKLVHEIMQLASKTKQNVNRDDALALLEKVNSFAEIFWQTKDVKTKRATCPYPPALEVVYPDL